MFKKIHTYQIFLVLCFLFYALSLFFSSREFIYRYEKYKLNHTQEFLWELENHSNHIFNQLAAKPTLELQDFTDYYKADYTLLYYENGELKYWSNKAYVPNSVSRITTDGQYIFPVEEDAFFVHSKWLSPTKTIHFVKPMGNSKVVKSFSIFNPVKIVSFQGRNNFFIPALNLSGDRIGTLSIEPIEYTTGFVGISWALSILFLLLTFVTLFIRLPKTLFKINKVFWLLFFLFMVKNVFKSDPHQVIENVRLFQPNLFGNTYVGQSLGLLVFNVVIISICVFIWYRDKARFRFIRRWPLVLKGLYFVGGFLLTFYLLSYTVRSVVLDSAIRFSFEPFGSRYSFTFLLLLFMCMLLYLLINLRLIRYVKTHFTHLQSALILLVLTVVSLATLLIAFTFTETLFLVSWQAATLSLLYFLIHNKERQIKQLSGFVLYFVLCSIFCAQNLQQNTRVKSSSKVLQSARKLSLENDNEAMYDIEQLLQKIQSDEVIQDQISKPFVSRQTIIKRIENRYINDLLKTYNITFNFKKGGGLQESKLEPLTNYSDFKFRLSVQFQNLSPSENLIIDFEKPKLDQTDLLPVERTQYSYAFYTNDNLKYLKGNLEQIDLSKFSDLKIGGFSSFKQNDDTNLVYKYKDNSLLQISVNDPIINSSIVLLFCNFFSALFFSFIIFLLISNGFKLTNSSFFRHSLANQIQFLVIAILYLTGFVVTSISMREANNQLRKAGQTNYEALLNDVVNGFMHDEGMKQSFQDYLNENYQNIKSQLHFFQPDGKLLYTNSPSIYEEAKWPKLVNPFVWNEFKTKPLQNVIEKEKIATESFDGFYRVIRSDHFDIKGMLYLPAFQLNRTIAQQKRLVVESQFNTFSIVLFSLTLLSLIISQSLTDIFQRLRHRLLGAAIGEERRLIEWENQDEIGELIHEYNDLVKKLDESAVLLARNERESAWRDVAKQVAHEIKNPLTPMKLSIQHLRRRIAAEEYDENNKAILNTLSSLETQVDHLENIANNFSSFSKLDLPVFKKQDLMEIVKETWYLYNSSPDFVLEFKNDITTEPALINADETMLTRVFNNLLKNASQALVEHRPGKIEIHLAETDTEYIIDVTDNGKGISIANRAKIFTPNFTTKTSGTGIGLMMSKRILEMHRGSIKFISQEDEGTTFTVTLPKLSTTV